MAVTFTATAIAGQTLGVAITASITVVANTRKLFFFVPIDTSNDAAGNIAPNAVSWGATNATLVGNIPTDPSAPFGQCQWLYEIDSPAAATATATVNHAATYHTCIVVAVVSPTPISITSISFLTRGTGTSLSTTISSASGDQTIYSIVANNLASTDMAALNGSTQLAVTGTNTRQTVRASLLTSSGTTNTESWTLTSSQQYSVIAVNVADGTFRVDDINSSGSSPAINVASSNTANTTGMSTITSLTISDGTRSLSATPSMPSGDGTFAFTWPYADAVVAPLFGSVTATFGDGARTVDMVGNTPVPAGFASVTFTGATDISQYHLGHVLTLTDGKRMYYPTTNGAVINSDGSLEFTALPYTLNAMLHNVHSGGDGTITSVTVVITESGAVVVTGGGLTSSGLTSHGFTSSGLTSPGL